MTTHNRLTKFFACAIALAMVLVAAHVRAETVDQVITVLRVKGGARYCTDGSMKKWIMLRKGDVLKPGALLQTAEDGQVDVLLGERQMAPISPMHEAGQVLTYKQDSGPKSNVIHIFPSSVLAVDKLTLDRTGMDEVGETQLDLRAGQIMGNVKKLSNASRYEIKIPNGVAGVRGTTYIIHANGQVYVTSGSVVVSYVDSTGTLRTQVVQAGYYLTPQPNGPPIIATFDPNKVPGGHEFDGVPTTTPYHYPGNAGNPIIERISPN